jgi:hypothetical protein
MGRQRLLNLDCRQDEEASTVSPLQLCPLHTHWCAVWLFHVFPVWPNPLYSLLLMWPSSQIRALTLSLVDVTAVAGHQYLFHHSYDDGPSVQLS